MPLFLLLAAGLGLLLVAEKKSATSQSSAVDLDANMPLAQQQQILAMLANDSNPADLTAQANAIAVQYPQAAYELNLRAWQLSGSQGPAPMPPGSLGPVAPTTPVTPVTPASPATLGSDCVGLDTGMPATTCTAVRTALTTETNPDNLRGFASSLSEYPIAAAMLLAKADALAGTVPTTPGTTTTTPCDAYAPGIDPETCEAIQLALTSITDPNSVQALAEGIQTKYPAAYALLEARYVQLLAQQAANAPGATPTPASPAPISTTCQNWQPATSPEAAQIQASILTGTGPQQYTEGGNFLDTLSDGTNWKFVMASQNGVPAVATYQCMDGVAPVQQSAGHAVGFDPGRVSRPPGYPFVLIRPKRDHVLPTKLATIGSGNQESFALLTVLNPHLITPDGRLPEFRGGDEINVPPQWVEKLRARGFLVREK